MKVTRRNFLKLSATALAATAFGGLGVSLNPTLARAQLLKLRWSKQTTSICPYCAVGCGLVVHTALDGSGRAVNVEGDPDHPVNEGALCAKGASIWQLCENDKRITNCLYRAPNSEHWEVKSWDWMLATIAQRIKQTRDKTWETKNSKGQIVNRTEGIASVGSAALDNEECWLYQGFLRALGLVYIEHQARPCHSSTVAALAESFGRGAMTNHWIDIKNADCIWIQGSNAAENHPISFKWITEAKERGATIINLDPRFTRTSAKADIYAAFRSGTDIAIFGGLIKYILDNDLIQKDYVVSHTNATFIVNEKFESNVNGLFSGFDAKKQAYDKACWAFDLDENGVPKMDPSLKHERCVYQLLKKHYARYSVENVSQCSGAPVELLNKAYEAYAATGKPDKAGTFMYAMGQTQHTYGVQNIRAFAIVQLLLGNIGVAGGGINALRGESNVQGSTDHCLLYHILPGYLGTPRSEQTSLEDYDKRWPVTKDPKSANWWQNGPKYIASFLKAMYPDAEVAKSYKWLPRIDSWRAAGNASDGYSWLALFDRMYRGGFKGFFSWGQNPACSAGNAVKTRQALAKLDWLVTVNLFDNETSSFWKGPDVDPKKIKTEVFFLPCAVSIEKEGSITNSGRWMQWRYEGPKPMGESKSDGDIICELMDKVRKLYAAGGAMAKPVLAFNLEGCMKDGRYAPHTVAKLINGYFLKDVTIKDKTYKKGALVPNFVSLQADGSTCSGNWLYCGSYNESGNMSARRDKTQTKEQANIGLFPGWSWCWPVNRRIIYNRASCDNNGRPYAPDKAVISWDGKKWIGDVPDGGWAPGTKHAFIMRKNGFGQMFGPGLNDGPFPEHYEPMDCPIRQHPFSNQLQSPVALGFKGDRDSKAVCDPRYPLVCSTYRVTEHWQTGVMTRWTPWLLETQPQVFCEMSEELAKLKGVKNGSRVVLESPRGAMWAIAIVTKRFKPFNIMGQTVHQVGLPWHYGWIWPEDGGDSANLLTPSVGDANTGIPETKAFMVNLRKA